MSVLVTITYCTVPYVGGDVAMCALPPELLGDAAQSALEAIMGWNVQSTDDAFTQVWGQFDAQRVMISIYMPEMFVLYDKQVLHFDEQLKGGIKLDIVVTEFSLCNEVISDARDCGIGALLVEPVGTKF